MNKKTKELAINEKDTGSSEVQVGLLTEKIENLSKHISKFKKDNPVEVVNGEHKELADLLTLELQQ